MPSLTHHRQHASSMRTSQSENAPQLIYKGIMMRKQRPRKRILRLEEYPHTTTCTALLHGYVVILS